MPRPLQGFRKRTYTVAGQPATLAFLWRKKIVLKNRLHRRTAANKFSRHRRYLLPGAVHPCQTAPCVRGTPFSTHKAAHCKNLARPLARPLPGNFLPLPATTFCPAGLLPIQLSIVFSGPAFFACKAAKVSPFAALPPTHYKLLAFNSEAKPRTAISTRGVPGTRCTARLAPMPAPANTGCKGSAIGAFCSRLFCGTLPGRAGKVSPVVPGQC